MPTYNARFEEALRNAHRKRSQAAPAPVRTLMPCDPLPGSRVKHCTVFSDQMDSVGVLGMLSLRVVDDRLYVGKVARNCGFDIAGFVIAVITKDGKHQGYW